MLKDDSKVLRRGDSSSVNALRSTPFGLLKASTRDDRSKIVSLAEEQSLFLDQELCSKARQDLTNPRNRLQAEVAWLPGLAPRKAENYVELLDVDLSQYIQSLRNEQPIVKANLIAAVLDVLSEDESNATWVDLIIELAGAAERFDSIVVLRQINEDRQLAGFAEVQGVEALEEPFELQKKKYRESVKDALNRMESEKLLDVIGLVAKEATENGTQHAPILIDEIIDSYRLEVSGFLEAESENIAKVVDVIKGCAENSVDKFPHYFEQLEKLVDNWSRVALPIQLSMKSRGMEHDLSYKTGYTIRGAGLRLFNDHDLMAETKAITGLLKKYFQHFPELAEKAEDDTQTLSDIERTRSFAELLKPFKNRLTEDLAYIDSNPAKAEQVANKLVQDLPKMSAAARAAGVPEDLITAEEDFAAQVLVSCAVSYGNHSENWQSCINIIESAKRFARSTSTIERANTNLQTVTRNAKLYQGLTPIKSAPTLQTINGCGFTLYGSSDVDHESGSYMTTYYFVMIFVPIFPICRYRVISSGGNSYRFLGKGPLRDFDKWHLGISILLLLYMFFGK
jgi:gas vesicle protein